MIAVWALEWRLAVTDRRRFAVSALVPLLLALTFASGITGPGPAAAVYLVLFVAFSMFGSAVPLRWDGERGMVRRVVAGGVPAGRYLLSRAGAGASIDLVQLTPSLLVAGLGAAASPGDMGLAFLALAGSVWVAGLIGALVAGVSRSLPETALVAGLVILLLAHMSGVFETPAPGSLLASAALVSPFRALHGALLELTAGVSSGGAEAALGWALLLPALVLVSGRWITASLGRVARGGLEGV